MDETPTFAGCPVPEATLAAWKRHWSPPSQPFFISDALARRLPPWPRFTRKEFQQSGVPLSLHDTFATYDVTGTPRVAWLTYRAFYSLGGRERLELLTEQRGFGRGGVVHLGDVADQLDTTRLSALTADGLFVWWPQLWNLLHASEQNRVLQTFVETDRLFCRRGELSSEDWRRVASSLPGARELAGSFLPESGGNCLATVIAAFGAPAIAECWVHPEPFERWLEQFSLSDSAQMTRAPALGQVLVWRDENVRVQHAAVSLGKDFVLHKEAQGWYAPRQVSRLDETLARWQDDGKVSVYESVTSRKPPNS